LELSFDSSWYREGETKRGGGEREKESLTQNPEGGGATRDMGHVYSISLS